jgi:hypothetical protein
VRRGLRASEAKPARQVLPAKKARPVLLDPQDLQDLLDLQDPQDLQVLPRLPPPQAPRPTSGSSQEPKP